MDIFFFIASVVACVVIVAGILLCIFIIRLNRNIESILDDVKHISKSARIEGEKIINDVSNLRESAKSNVQAFSKIFSFFSPKKRATIKVKKAKSVNNNEG